jgi:glycosyltransferase involved in cell wall biosynthesis
MSNEPSVSVIIPTYNRARFVPSAVQSVLDQTFQNVEIIVVDDGSTDDTRRALEPFGKKIRCLVTENKGPAHARNIGMKAASGKYVAFLDSDDLYLPGKLEWEISFLEAHPEVGMVFTEFSATDGSGILEEYHLRTFHGIYDRKGWLYENVFPLKGEFICGAVGKPIPYYIGDIFKYVLMGPLVVSTTVLFPREILKVVGYQNESYHLAEEYEFIVRICRRYKAAFLNIPTYLYRYHPDQISKARQAKTRQKVLTEIETEKVITQAIMDWGYNDPDYYARNRDWLDHQLAEQYLCLGEKWLDFGDSRRARKCFKIGHTFDPAFGKNRQSWWLSYVPSLGRRIFWGVSHRIQKWAY